MTLYEMNWKEKVSFYGEVEAENEKEAIEKVKAGAVIDPNSDTESELINSSIQCVNEIT